MAKGKMGERVSEDAQLKLTDLVVECGYKARKGWEFLFERLAGWWFQICLFYFHPDPWGNDPNLTNILQMG